MKYCLWRRETSAYARDEAPETVRCYSRLRTAKKAFRRAEAAGDDVRLCRGAACGEHVGKRVPVKTRPRTWRWRVQRGRARFYR